MQQVFVHPVLYIQGETYLGGKNTKGRNGSGGVVTDFLLKNISSNSICVVEIKTPCTDLINQSVYRGSGNGKNNDIHSTGSDLSGSVIQLENQIHEAINNFKTVIGSDESTKDVGILDPRGVLIIGTYSDLSDSQKRSFNLFRKSLSRDIVTFDELLEKMKMLLNIY
ncbi:MAG: DUF4263 domain-containing protein [Chitinophagaceae bacterium]|nr:DUF4263 domain-containing protein [Chitinophagaceae bacterium]